MSFLDLFKAKKTNKPSNKTPKTAPAAAPATPSETPNANQDLQQIANQTYPGIAIYVRDANLPKALSDKYTPGRIILERAFTDASNRVMGMVTTHRYMILSNHMKNFSSFEQGTNWGLHVAQNNSRFKVLGQHSYNGKTAIVLLHLPNNDTWKVFKNCNFSLDEQLYQMSIQRFEAKCEQPPIPELATPQWLNRCAFPVGMDDKGNFWNVE